MNQLHDYISANYNRVREHLRKYASNRGMDWDEDIFHLTLLKVLERRRLKDMSDQGILNYIFMSFRTNMLRERQYPYNARRVIIDELPDLPDIDNSDDDHEAEFKSDFKAHVIMRMIELAFSQDHYNAYRLKTFTELTYKQLHARTGLQHPRKLVKEVRDWLSSSVDEEELDRLFYAGMSVNEAADYMLIEREDKDDD